MVLADCAHESHRRYSASVGFDNGYIPRRSILKCTDALRDAYVDPADQSSREQLLDQQFQPSFAYEWSAHLALFMGICTLQVVHL